MAVAHHRDGHRYVFTDRGGVDVDVDDFGLASEGVGLAGDPVVEPHADGDQKVAVAGAHVGPVGAVHADHAQPEGIGAGKGSQAHQGGRDRGPGFAREFGEGRRGFGQDKPPPAKSTGRSADSINVARLF